jgi:hypothetical protein
MSKDLSGLLLIVLAFAVMQPCYGWQNSYPTPLGASCSRCYGTHNFLAEHALALLPYEPPYFFLMAPGSRPYGVFASENYLSGTSLPDLGGLGFKPDWELHAVYYSSDGSLIDDYAARRAQESYEQVLSFLRNGDMKNAAIWMGITSHYVTDVTSYWHVMGKGKEWVTASKNGLTYENRVKEETNDYNAPFASCLSFDGKLEHVSAYDITLKLAYDTTFDTSGSGRTAKWMDDNYDKYDNPTYPYYRERVCESLNLAANAVADLIYSAVQPATDTTTAVLTAATRTNEATTSTVTIKTTLISTSNVTVIVTTESVPSVGTAMPIAISFILAIVLLWVFVRSRRKPAESSTLENRQSSASKGEIHS